MSEQNRFEILGCLLEDNEANDEEPKDVIVLRSTSPGATPSATSMIPIVCRLVKTKCESREPHGLGGQDDRFGQDQSGS